MSVIASIVRGVYYMKYLGLYRCWQSVESNTHITRERTPIFDPQDRSSWCRLSLVSRWSDMFLRTTTRRSLAVPQEVSGACSSLNSHISDVKYVSVIAVNAIHARVLCNREKIVDPKSRAYRLSVRCDWWSWLFYSLIRRVHKLPVNFSHCHYIRESFFRSGTTGFTSISQSSLA